MAIRAYNFSGRQIPVANAVLRNRGIAIADPSVTRFASRAAINSTEDHLMQPPGVRTMLTLGPSEAVVAATHDPHDDIADRVAWQPTQHVDIQRVTQTAIVSILYLPVAMLFRHLITPRQSTI